MAYTQADLDALDSRIDDVRKVTYSDGRAVEKHDLDQLLKLREAMQADITRATRARSGVRTTVGRIYR
jgi:hypothetical protein